RPRAATPVPLPGDDVVLDRLALAAVVGPGLGGDAPILTARHLVGAQRVGRRAGGDDPEAAVIAAATPTPLDADGPLAVVLDELRLEVDRRIGDGGAGLPREVTGDDAPRHTRHLGAEDRRNTQCDLAAAGGGGLRRREPAAAPSVVLLVVTTVARRRLRAANRQDAGDGSQVLQHEATVRVGPHADRLFAAGQR